MQDPVKDEKKEIEKKESEKQDEKSQDKIKIETDEDTKDTITPMDEDNSESLSDSRVC